MFDAIPNRVSHFGAPGGHFAFCRHRGVASGERVPQMLHGWNLDRKLHFTIFVYFQWLFNYIILI